MDVLDYQIYLAGLLEELDYLVEGIRGDFEVALRIFLIAPGEDLGDKVYARRVFLLDFDPEFL